MGLLAFEFDILVKSKKSYLKSMARLGIFIVAFTLLFFALAIPIASSLPGDLQWQATNAKGEKTLGGTVVDASENGDVLLAGSLSSGAVSLSRDAGVSWYHQENLGVKQWVATAVSADGMHLAVAAWADNIFTSSDGGETWVERVVPGPRYWQSLAFSLDGTRLVAAGVWGHLYQSGDSGKTWTELTNAGSREWNSVAVSSDGTQIIASDRVGYIHTSTDSGLSWTQQTGAGSRAWSDVAMSADGTKMAVTATGSQIYLSGDSGTSWTAQTSLGVKDWSAVSMSADGAKLAAVVKGYTIDAYNVYLSANFGNTWAQQPIDELYGNMQSIVYSRDGSSLIAVNGAVSISTNDGDTWALQFISSKNVAWRAIASSDDASRLIAVQSGGYISTSSDSGLTWASHREVGKRDWQSVASSSDGTRLMAVSYDNNVYMSSDSGVSWQTKSIPSAYQLFSLATSSDGSVILAGEYWNGPLYLSKDMGDTWEVVPDLNLNGSWSNLSISSDGSTMIAVDSRGVSNEGGYAYVSHDGGENWQQQTSLGYRYWQDWVSGQISISDDGQTIALVDYYGSDTNNWDGGYVYLTRNGGTDWQTLNDLGFKNWASSAVSSDGMHIAVASSNGNIYMSDDGGATWHEQNNGINLPRNFRSIASSADGTKLVVAVSSNGVYVGTKEGAATTSFDMNSLPSGSQGSTDMAILGAQLNITSDTCYTIDESSVATLDPSSVSGPIDNMTLIGGIAFSINCVSVGGSSEVDIILDANYVDTNRLRVYKSQGSSLSDITDQVLIRNQDVSGEIRTSVSYALTDGGLLDEDGLANSTIVDPIYIGLLDEPGSLAPNNTSSGGSAGLDTLADTGFSAWRVIVFSTVIFMSGIIIVIRLSNRATDFTDI